MTTLPPLLKTKPNRVRAVRCPAHRAWVRKHSCCVPGCPCVPIEFAHVRTGTDGGMGLKPGDMWGISMCAPHHREQHAMGERAFEEKHGIDMKALAKEFAKRSPHKHKLEQMG